MTLGLLWVALEGCCEKLRQFVAVAVYRARSGQAVTVDPSLR